MDDREKQDELDELFRSFCDEYDDFSALEEFCSNEILKGIGLGNFIPSEEPNTTENVPVNQHPLPSCPQENIDVAASPGTLWLSRIVLEGV